MGFIQKGPLRGALIVMGLTKIVVKGLALAATAAGLAGSVMAQAPVKEASKATPNVQAEVKRAPAFFQTHAALPATRKDATKRFKSNQEAFVENKGQWSPEAKYLAKTQNLRVWVTDKGWVLDSFKRELKKGKIGSTGQVVNMDFLGGNPRPTMIPNAFNGSVRDYMGPAKIGKVSGVKAYGEVMSKNVYSGIDVNSYMEKGRARFDVIVAPNADPNQAKLKFSGASQTSLDKKGNLVAKTNVGDIKFTDLKAFQYENGAVKRVSVAFEEVSKDVYGFKLGAYDHSKELTIDPIAYGTYYGGDDGWDEVHAITADQNGGVYLTGNTQAQEFPKIQGPYGFNLIGNQSAFISKLQGDVYSHDYAAYFGGNAGSQSGDYLQIDPNGDIWVAGISDASNFPGGGVNGQTAYIMRWKFLNNGLLDPEVGSEKVTFLSTGGAGVTIQGFAIVPSLDANGNVTIVIAGATGGALSNIAASYTGQNSYLGQVKFDPANGSFAWDANVTQYIGETAPVIVRGCAVDSVGNVYISGTVQNVGTVDTAANPGVFQTTAGVFGGDSPVVAEGRLLRNSDIFVRKYSPTGTLIYSGLIGGDGFDGAGGVDTYVTGAQRAVGSNIAVDRAGNAYVLGRASSFNFPRTRGVFGEVFTANVVATVTKVSADGAHILYSTHLRTSNQALPGGIAVDERGDAFVTGNVHPWTVDFTHPQAAGDDSANQPIGFGVSAITVTPDADQAAPGVTATPDLPTADGFLNVLNSTGTALIYGTYIGGALDEEVYAPFVDNFGDCWVCGYTDNRRRYFRGTIAAPILHDVITSLPTVFITPLAFKPSPDDHGGTFENGVAYGILDTRLGAVTPFFINNVLYWRDGFLVRFRIGLPVINSVTLDQPTLAGGLGSNTTGHINLSAGAPAGGMSVVVTLSSTTAASLNGAQPLGSIIVTIPGGATTASFPIFTFPVTALTNVDVKAEFENNFKVTRLVVAPWLTQLSITPSTVVGGNPATGRVRLFQNAGGAGVVVALDSDSAFAIPGASVTVPAGQTTITFPINTLGVSTNSIATITGSLLGVGAQQQLTVTAPNLLTLTFNPQHVNGGSTAIGTVKLDGAAGPPFNLDLAVVGAPAGYTCTPSTLTFPLSTTVTTGANSATQKLSSTTDIVLGDKLHFGAANVDRTVLSITNATTVILDAPVVTTAGDTVTDKTNSVRTFTLQTSSEPVDIVRTVTATRQPQGTYTFEQISGSINVDSNSVSLLTVSPATVNGGDTSNATLTLLKPADTGGMQVTMSSTDPSVTLQGSDLVFAQSVTVVVPAGATSAVIPIHTTAILAALDVTIKAQITGGAAQTAPLHVNPVVLVGFTISPNVVNGGQNSVGTVTLSGAAPTGGVNVDIASDSGATHFTSPVNVPAGALSAPFTIATDIVSNNTTAHMSASIGGGTPLNANLTINATAINGISFSPARVRGGRTTKMTLTFTAPLLLGTTITFTNSNPRVTPSLSPYIVGAGDVGKTSITINCTTFRVSRSLGTIVSATCNGTTVSTTLVATR